MTEFSRREMLAAPVALAAASALPARPATGKMTLAIHQNTSNSAGYRKSLEGWARAGIKDVEITNVLLDEFLKTETLAAAKRVITDLGLNLVQAATGATEIWEPSPNRAAALDNLTKRCEMYASMGLNCVYSPTTCTRKITEDDYKAGVDNIHEAGEIAKQFKQSLRIEFLRSSTFISTLPTVLRVTREAAHPNIAPMLDCYHFWSGLNKFEDLDLLRSGEIAHVHFQDVPDIPRELLDLQTRIIPGDGISPLTRILRKLSEKGYAGPLSVELFLPKFQQADPYELAVEIRKKSEAVISQAGVL